MPLYFEVRFNINGRVAQTFLSAVSRTFQSAERWLDKNRNIVGQKRQSSEPIQSLSLVFFSRIPQDDLSFHSA
jgi:hypothetical protein